MTMYKEMINTIKWNDEKIVYLNNGSKKKVYTATNIPANFWGVWKIHKEKIKESGLSVKRKMNGDWIIEKWEDIIDEPLSPLSINLNKEIENILFDYQITHVKQLLSALQNNKGVLDASDTGTGKTFCALAIAKQLNLFPIIVTKKSIIYTWKRIAWDYFGHMQIFVSNYEQYKNGNTPYVQKMINKNNKEDFQWSVPDNSIIIFDEVHSCKNPNTLNSDMLKATLNTNSTVRIMLLSATIADNPLHLKTVGRVIGLFYNNSQFWNWATKRGLIKGYFGYEFNATQKNLLLIHNDIFPSKGGRISIKELGNKFPDNLIITDCYDMNSNGEKIQYIYENMYNELSNLQERKKSDSTSVLTEILRARQEIELLKVPTFVELAENHIEEGMSAAIFVNFEETVQSLAKRLQTNCIITGSTNDIQRQQNIENFQNDISRIIICNIKAGGLGISLHDINGKYPRVSLISPTFSAQDLKQALGRIHRAGAKSPAIQKIIFCAGTVEEKVAKKVAMKIKNIDTINDGDIVLENNFNDLFIKQ